jgi:hypothetical protein
MLTSTEAVEEGITGTKVDRTANNNTTDSNGISS